MLINYVCFNNPAPTWIYPYYHTLSLHYALPSSALIDGPLGSRASDGAVALDYRSNSVMTVGGVARVVFLLHPHASPQSPSTSFTLPASCFRLKGLGRK